MIETNPTEMNPPKGVCSTEKQPPVPRAERDGELLMLDTGANPSPGGPQVAARAAQAGRRTGTDTRSGRTPPTRRGARL